MKNNQIKNTKTEVPKGLELNDKDFIGSLLSCLKSMEKNYTVALTEASNETLFDIYKGVFDEIALMQREVYELMFRKGWYCMEQAEQQKISTKYQTLNTEYNDLEISFN